MNGDVFTNTHVHPNLALNMGLTQQPVCCLVIENASDEQLRALGLTLVHLYRQGTLCALLFEPPAQDRWQETLRTALAELSLTAGMSGPFALPASAHGCMRKAQLALETGSRLSPGRTLYPMSEYAEAALVGAARAVLESEGFVREDFCDAAVTQMMAQDAQAAKSLHAYLASGLDLKRAAQALKIHRNTLDYRMKRVQERFALDLADERTCFELLFSFWLAGHFPSGEAPQADDAPYDPQAAQAALWRCMEGGEDREDARFALRLLGVSAGNLADEERGALMHLLRSLLPPCGACAFDEEMLLFALPPQEMDAFAAACRTVCDQRGLCTVVTQALGAQRIMQRARLCRMALYAVGQGHVRLQDMGSTLFFMALERRIPLSPYLCEEVIRVMDDDAVRGTALSGSLYAYLLHFMDMKRAAAQMGMHRNTMEYQMRKIEALIGRPVLEAQRFFMMCTYKMLALPDMHRFGL